MENNRGYLIDTNIFIWWMEKSKKLSKNLFDLLNNPHSQIFLSVASIWEVVIKRKRGKLKLSRDIRTGLEKSGFRLLDIEVSHVLETENLPGLHWDPFDRILIAQAKVENLTLITTDEKIWRYDVDVVKA